jgi:hypothetical protein
MILKCIALALLITRGMAGQTFIHGPGAMRRSRGLVP